MMEPRRINLRVDEELFKRLNDKRHAEDTTFQRVGIRLLQEWLADPDAGQPESRPLAADQRLMAALRALSLRCAGVWLAARALPPLRPISAAVGVFLVVLCIVRSISVSLLLVCDPHFPCHAERLVERGVAPERRSGYLFRPCPEVVEVCAELYLPLLFDNDKLPVAGRVNARCPAAISSALVAFHVFIICEALRMVK